MFLQEFERMCVIGKSIQLKLPRRNLILDPRVNDPHECRFDCHYHDDGITVTLTRLDDVDDEVYRNDDECASDEYTYVGETFNMRVYDPATEAIPDFDSKTYLYLGFIGEYAPADTIVGIIDPSVKAIKREAFSWCKKMRRCVLHGEVETIDEYAFEGCFSLDALFLPPSLNNIGIYAFSGCRNIRFLLLPPRFNIRQFGYRILASCDSFFSATKINKHQSDDQVNRAIADFHRNLSPLYQTCFSINVSAQAIHDCILTHGTAVAFNSIYDGMTPMHILVLNPHASTASIQACFDANMSAVFVRYSQGRDDDDDDEYSTLGSKTPLDCLMEYDVDSHTSVVTALCMHRNAMMGELNNE